MRPREGCVAGEAGADDGECFDWVTEDDGADEGEKRKYDSNGDKGGMIAGAEGDGGDSRVLSESPSRRLLAIMDAARITGWRSGPPSRS